MSEFQSNSSERNEPFNAEQVLQYTGIDPELAATSFGYSNTPIEVWKAAFSAAPACHQTRPLESMHPAEWPDQVVAFAEDKIKKDGDPDEEMRNLLTE